MPRNTRLCKTLSKLLNEQEKGNRAINAIYGYRNDQDLPSLILFLWHGETLESKPKEKAKKGEIDTCFVAYDFFDYRLGWKNPLKFETKAKRGLISFEMSDVFGSWRSEFDIQDPYAGKSASNEYHDCDHDETGVVISGSGLEKIRSSCCADDIRKVNALTVSVKII